MTQMNLADAMEVSFEALLGSDTSAKTVEKIIQNELTIDETSEPTDITSEEAAEYCSIPLNIRNRYNN